MKQKIYLFVSSFAMFIILLANKVFAQTKPNTTRQMESLIKEKQSRSAVEQKIDSRLLHAIRDKQGLKTGKLVPPVPAMVLADGNGNIEVDINAEVTDSLLHRIKVLGGRILFPSKRYHTIRASVNLMVVEKIAGYPEVKFIAPASVPKVERAIKPA
ncbi:MAG: hypothetical protein WKF89_16690 [Chitinophagaceae bacterium]